MSWQQWVLVVWLATAFVLRLVLCVVAPEETERGRAFQIVSPFAALAGIALVVSL